ncbi:MAG TPA: Ca2+-dependent phosphoinositide-specific phospholipase C [Pseudomonadota bacterium]|nr:Ca2+-dependent phosphoinositide-specific phospholipase C [Pseudomonadota bacterium]
MRTQLLSVLSLLVSLGCSSADTDREQPNLGKPFHYPSDGELRLSDVQVRGTHNSYHVDTHAGSVEAWAYTHAPLYDQLDRLGIRQIELDVFFDEQDGLQVQHVPFLDTGTRCKQFSDCLSEIRRFSDAYPGHFPIYVQIEPKADVPESDMESFFAKLEGEILAAFPRERILTPDEVQADFPTLPAALKTRGWPLLQTLRGRVFFAFDTTGPLRTAYTHKLRDLHGRLLFVDSSPTDSFAAVAVLNDPQDPAGVMNIGKAVRAGLLVRSRADADTKEARVSDTSRGQAALSSGAHFISTDYPEPVSGFSYHFEVPGGKPARCNPVTAPKSCTPLALEDPAFVGSANP